MSNKDKSNQEIIKNWFDQTYRKKGYRYLRPIDAYKCFITALGAKKGGKLLDVACGPGLMLKVAEENELLPFGIDITETGVAMAKKLVKTANVQVANAEKLPFSDGQFDYITCLGSLERMLNLPLVLQEQLRVGVSDATYCFMVRNSKTLLWSIKTFFHLQNLTGHQGAKTLEEWSTIFTAAGFKIQAVHKDSWPWIKWFRFLLLAPLFNYYKVRNTPIPLKNSFEFVFILQKK